MGGGTYSNDGDVNGQHGNQDFWLLRTDASGNLLWQRSLGGSNHEVCYGLAVSTSGYLLACGGTNSTNGQVTGKRGAYDGWVVSLDGNGNLQWSACMGGTMSESFSALTLNGNELLLAGYTSSNDGDVHGNHGSSDGWLVRCDLNGNLIDSRCYGGSQGMPSTPSPWQATINFWRQVAPFPPTATSAGEWVWKTPGSCAPPVTLTFAGAWQPVVRRLSAPAASPRRKTMLFCLAPTPTAPTVCFQAIRDHPISGFLASNAGNPTRRSA